MLLGGLMGIGLFHKKIRIEGESIDLLQDRKIKGSVFNDFVPSVLYRICLHGTDTEVGNCDLRLGMNEELYYAGNIGYRIYPQWRGNGYAYRAALLLLKEARDTYGMDRLIITCSPDNIPSRKTLEKLNGTLLETTDVPASHWLYARGETVKNIYEFRLADTNQEDRIVE